MTKHEETLKKLKPVTNLARNRGPARERQTFEAGDTVRVVCKPNHAPAWNATYLSFLSVSSMDRLVFKQGVVDRYTGSGLVGVMIKGEDHLWFFPPNSLMLVKTADGEQASNGDSSKPTVQQRGATAGKSGGDMAKEQRVLRCRSFDGTRLGDEDVYFSALQSWLAHSNYDGWIWSSDQKHKPSNCWYVVEVLPYDDSFALLREIYGTGDVLDGLGSKADAARAAVALAKGDLKPGPIVEAPPEEERRFAIIPIDMSDIELRTIAQRTYTAARVLAQNTLRSTTSQENTMSSTMSSIKIETITFVNGTPVKELSQDNITAIISQAEHELAGYNSVVTKTKALKAKIATLQKGIADLVEISDARYAAENPGEAAVEA